VPWPPQGLYNKSAVSSAADMQGVKFRAYNAATSRLAELMGAVPTKIEAAEISQAFATGVADSMISSGSTGYDRKLWEHVGYWYDVQAWLPKNMVIVNKEAWDGLDAATQGIVLGASAMAEEAGWAEAERLAKYEIVAPCTNPGDLVLMDFLTLHQSGANISDRPRWSMQFRYFNFCDPIGIDIAWAGSYAAGQKFEDILPDLKVVR